MVVACLCVFEYEARGNSAIFDAMERVVVGAGLHGELHWNPTVDAEYSIQRLLCGVLLPRTVCLVVDPTKGDANDAVHQDSLSQRHVMLTGSPKSSPWATVTQVGQKSCVEIRRDMRLTIDSIL